MDIPHSALLLSHLASPSSHTLLPFRSTANKRIFDLNGVPDCILKQIVCKFNFRAGARFYRSWKGAKSFADRVKPVWHIPNATLNLFEEFLRLDIGGFTVARQSLFEPQYSSAKLPVEFFRFEKLYVAVQVLESCNFKTVILPQIAAIGSIRTLGFSDEDFRSESELQLLVAAVKPEAVDLSDAHYDLTSAVFEHVSASPETAESYWTTSKVFKLARSRQTITLTPRDSHVEIIASFIENWLQGEATGSLKKFSIILPTFWSLQSNMEHVQLGIENLMKSFRSSPEGYVVEIGGQNRLLIRINYSGFKIGSVTIYPQS